ncbi:neuropeptide CCHamide-1 isoform X2 [Leguminivora glycinivorella]|uniref:neuropeptide CCHamide-1 isoform X2 n=1 Tax=Leguminivora glycinivorella TaxID=1035111 RepID=UPI00200FE9FC|nr:neuropeptide CCHamide-1 isoform X2 [Leguminivora glycinivorella]
MHRIDSKRVQGAASASAILALLLIICLAECATGSCLSYGHSCWGAHGKRSAKPPTAAPDWYLTRLLRHMAVNAEMNRARQEPTNDDINAIFQMDVQDDSQPNRLMSVNEDPAAMGPMKPEAIPMLDDDLLSKMKLWKIMRNAADEK